MAGANYLGFVIAIIPVFFIAYAAYWALSIRRALGVPVYRKQSLGVFLVGVALSCYIIAFSLYNWLGFQSGLETNLGVFISFGASPLLTFYWLDASTRAARRSDSLQREIFRWEKLRLVLWAWVLAAFFTLAGVLVGSVVVGEASPNSGPPVLPLFIFILSPIFLVATSGLVVLPRAAKFAGDKRFGKHVLWFGLFLFFTFSPLVSIFIPNLYAPSTPELVQVLVFALPQSVGGYCLYRSAGQLASLREPTVVVGTR